MSGRRWSSEEQLLVLRLYCVLPFGKLHRSNPEVIALAEAIGRTPSAVAMKACNFASLDPALDRKGLGNVSQADKDLWRNFQQNSVDFATRAEQSYEEVTGERTEIRRPDPPSIDQGETEVLKLVRARRVQGFFRRAVLVGYENRCALSGLRVPELLNASHIIPWKDNEVRRADPTNGIALNALYDRAFDRGLLAFDDHFRVMLSSKLTSEIHATESVEQLFNIENRSLMMPKRFKPDLKAIRYHRNTIYQK